MQRILVVLVFGLGVAVQPALGLDIQVQGLFRGAAVLVVDGRQQLVKAGERSREGVLLVSADTRQAVIEVEGQRRTLSLNRRITTQYQAPQRAQVSIRRNAFNQYITTAGLNGKRTSVLVDTGANAVAMNSNHARTLGLDYQNATRTQVQTASGVSPAYVVKLRSVEVGGIEVSNVDGFVIEGDFPQKVLLGMSFLQHVDIREESGILYLQGKY